MWTYLKEKFSKYVNLILQLDDTPESIARGVGIGMFIAMTPTVGIQMILVVVTSFFIQLNRVAGCVMVYISNPLTIIPIYWFDYWVGATIMRYDMVGKDAFVKIFDLQSTTFYEKFMEFMHNCLDVGVDVMIPMFVGGAVIGGVLGLILYPITLRSVRRFREQKDAEGRNPFGVGDIYT